jgi:hypothetical protein
MQSQLVFVLYWFKRFDNKFSPINVGKVYGCVHIYIYQVIVALLSFKSSIVF